MRITYGKEYKKEILDKAGLTIGKDGYLFDKKTNRPAKDINGELIKFSQFAGFKKGSIQYIKSDVASLIKLSKAMRYKSE